MNIRVSICVITLLNGIIVASCCSAKSGHDGYKIDYSAIDGLDASKHPTLRDKIKQVLVEHYHEKGHHGGLHGGWSAKAPVVLSTHSDIDHLKGFKDFGSVKPSSLKGFGHSLKGHGFGNTHGFKSHSYSHSPKAKGHSYGHGHGYHKGGKGKGHGYYSGYGHEDQYEDHPMSHSPGPDGDDQTWPSSEYGFNAFNPTASHSPSYRGSGHGGKHPYWKYRDMSELDGY